MFLLIFVSSTYGFVSRNQSFESRGRFICAGNPVRKATVELWEDNKPLWKLIRAWFLKAKGKVFIRSPTFDHSIRVCTTSLYSVPWDSFLTKTETDDTGSFTIKATFRRETEIVPYLFVFHRCDIERNPLSQGRPQVATAPLTFVQFYKCVLMPASVF
ncbi:unnamed protein product [Gongylonema pulchrum]|uniref:Transthyretin-like family protein n=1 Tax=Gongylonema pulchrum TaxID=637853 RepID=A0A183D2R7_9BILA|nr:unnamed protein product [Gongylonema pulchrum]